MTNLEGEKIPSVIAVSDGHGGNRYIRSRDGSNMAVLCAARIALENLQLSSKMRKDDLADVIRHIKSRYLLLWQKEVDNNINNVPFTEEEKTFLEKNCTPEERDSVLNDQRMAYGCTFLCAIAYDDLVLTLQLGDGNILGLYSGDVVEELMSPDPRNIGNETMSLCSLEVSDIAHEVFIGDKIPQLITLTTDGVKNSYDDKSSDIKSFYNIPVVIRNELQRNNGDTKAVKDGIEKLLEMVTTNGAGDDVTIGVLFRDTFGE
jgi:hypothetical protein